MKNLIIILIVIFSTLSCSTASSDIISEELADERPVTAQKPNFIKRVELLSTLWMQDQELMDYPSLILLSINASNTNLFSQFQPHPSQSCFYRNDWIITDDWNYGDHWGNITYVENGQSLSIRSEHWEYRDTYLPTRYTIHYVLVYTFELVGDKIIYSYTWQSDGVYLINGTVSGYKWLAEYNLVPNLTSNDLPICD